MEDWSKIPPNGFSNLFTNYRKGLMAVIFAQDIKPGVPIIVFWGGAFYLKKLNFC